MFRFDPPCASARNTRNRCAAGVSFICSTVPLYLEDYKIKEREGRGDGRHRLATRCAARARFEPQKAAQSGTWRQRIDIAGVSTFRSLATSGTSGTNKNESSV